MSIENIKNKYWVIIFTIYLRYIIGGVFVFASVVKIRGNRFTFENGETQPINSPWHLFETLYQSGIYWQFIGWGQLIAGLLLMTQRFSTLGALIYFPIITNIFVITISYGFPGTPIIAGLLLLSNLYLIIFDYKKLLPIINKNYQDKLELEYVNNLHDRSFWAILGAILFTITIINVVINDREPLLWLTICILTGGTGLLINKKL